MSTELGYFIQRSSFLLPRARAAASAADAGKPAKSSFFRSANNKNKNIAFARGPPAAFFVTPSPPVDPKQHKRLQDSFQRYSSKLVSQYRMNFPRRIDDFRIGD